MSIHSKALEFINILIAKYGKGSYILRGTTTIHSNEINEIEAGKVIHDGINSTLYRWVVRKDEKEEGAFSDEEHEILRKIFAENKKFSPAIMADEIYKKARMVSPKNSGGFQILTNLQHFGGKTNLIDFSHSVYIALFFACQGEFDNPGELIALNKNKFFPERRNILIVNPADTEESRCRVKFQKSVFVHPKNGYIDPKLCEIVKIEEYLKKPILEYLRKKEGIEPNTVYNDLHGFIKNQKNNETASLYFYMGTTSCNKEEYGNAIMYYSKSIEKNPESVATYTSRGCVYYLQGDLKRAIEDLNKAISINPNFAQAFYNRGAVREAMGNKKGAEADYAEGERLWLLSSPDQK